MVSDAWKIIRLGYNCTGKYCTRFQSVGCMHDSILRSCSLRKKFFHPVRNLMAQWLERRQQYMIFFLAAVQSPPWSTCNFFLLARVQLPPRVIRVKGDCFCIFALFKDTNNFCKPLGEKSTKKLPQKVTFAYFKNYSGFTHFFYKNVYQKSQPRALM